MAAVYCLRIIFSLLRHQFFTNQQKLQNRLLLNESVEADDSQLALLLLLVVNKGISSSSSSRFHESRSKQILLLKFTWKVNSHAVVVCLSGSGEWSSCCNLECWFILAVSRLHSHRENLYLARLCAIQRWQTTTIHFKINMR